MREKQILALAGALLVAALLILASPSAADPMKNKTAVDVWEVSCLVDPGIQWLSAEGILHVRGRVSQATFYESGSFDIVGSDTIVSNANLSHVNLDPLTFDGSLFGTWSAVYLPASNSGTFDGAWHARLTDGGFAVGKAVGQGSGELRGKKMKLNLVVDPIDDPPPPGLFSASGFPPCDPSLIVGIIHDTGFVHNPGGK